MYIAICDDDVAFVNNLKREVYSFCNQHKIESVIDTYHSGEMLLNSKISYDIILLDYQMDTLNGLATAKRLRKGLNSCACIIFLTNFPEIAISAYEVDTYRFVVKNTLPDGLSKALEDYRSAVKPNYIIDIKVKDEVINISTKDIVFLEANDKFVSIHLSDGAVHTIRIKLSYLYSKLPSSHFYRIHKSYVINFDFIAFQQGNNVKLKNCNYNFPISQNYIRTFEKKYISYLTQNII